MLVEIWSDVVCPWCYVGKRRLEQALDRFEHRDEVEVVWRAFELDPSASSSAEGDYGDRLARKYGTTREAAQQMLDSMTATAAEEGLAFRFDRAQPANTFEAHQVIHLGLERGVQDAVKERLMRAYFTEGEPVGDRATLVRLATEAGLEEDEVEKALATGEHAQAVRDDEAQATAYGASGVPFFVVDRRYGVAGAQPAEQLLAVLERAWSDAHPALTVLDPVDGAADACGPDGCAI